ncbi:hypothetical protein ACFQ61_09625 [Streptomyces sp. NPDC056500]
MSDTQSTDGARERTRPPVWRRLLHQAGLGAAGATGSALVALIIHWAQNR